MLFEQNNDSQSQEIEWVNIRDDAQRCWDEFSQDSSRLFVTQDDRITKIEVTADFEVRVSHAIHVVPGDTATESPAKNIFYIVQQEFSWGRFLITLDTFKGIFLHHDVFTPFLDFVRAFGCKTREDERVNDGFYKKVHQDPKVHREEICYNLRYLERNGRSRGDAWSLRQTGIYHSYDSKVGNSVWIILQPSTHIRNQFERAIGAINSMKPSGSGFALLHTFFLYSTERYWKDHLDALRKQFDVLGSLTMKTF